MANIKRLLNKSGWTGRELGQIELANLCTLYKQAKEGVKDPKPLVEPEQFQKMINSLTDRIQGINYNGYLSIHEWLGVKVNIANVHLQNAQLQFRTLSAYIREAVLEEDIYKYVEQLPYLITQKQYDELKANGIKSYYTDNDSGEELYSNIFSLVERAISFYLHQLQREPEKANPLKAIRKKYINEPVKSELILSRYNEVMGEGYYTLEDGRRSDQMTDEEWQNAITTPLAEDTLARMEAEDGSGAELTLALARQRLVNKARVILNGGTEEEAEQAERERYNQQGLTTPVVWHKYTEPPKDLTKWDIIEQELLLKFYPADISGSGDAYNEDSFTASMKDFYAEFRELATAMLTDMDKKYFSGNGTKTAELPIEEWENTLISWKELYEMDFYGEKAEAESNFSVFNGNKRAIFNGIAIVQPLFDKDPRIDSKGFYIEPKIEHTIVSQSLTAFFPESENYAKNVNAIDKARAEFIESYYYILGYNAQIDLVAAYFDVPELEAFKLDLDTVKEKIDAINDFIPLLYKQIKDTYYMDKELQARKMEVLKDVFLPLEYKALAIPEGAIEEAEPLLKDYSAFTGKRAVFDNLFCVMPQTEEDGEGAY